MNGSSYYRNNRLCRFIQPILHFTNLKGLNMSSENFVHPSTYRDADGNIAPENRDAWMKSMEEMSKERFVEIAELKVLRDRVSACFKKEGSYCWSFVESVGVNHEDNCKVHVDAYINFMKEKNFFK